ncbi:hypothetical protein Pint_13815 [Pistacia integerrima]|uniref:Uncharacterized protein n=1 Tax=Pistacia integerrima TaxID=434235 RepID=A0ACC0Y662_9ROSI|nr:hypothetical protein Pint_13815 [Pistacia integerrima]
MGNGKYKGGLVLIMWATSAEVTQGVFRNYDHPFAVTYLGTSLLVAYLPLAILKDLIRKFFRRPSSKSSNGSEPETVDIDRTSSRELDSRVHHGYLEAKPYGSPSNVKECAINICAKEEFESKDNEETLEQEGKVSAKEVATFGFGIAPNWFLTEVRALRLT